MGTTGQNETYPEVLTVSELCQATRLPTSTAYRLLRNGDIPSVKLGRRRLIRKEDLLRLLTPKE